MGIKGKIRGLALIEILIGLAILSILTVTSVFAVPRYINLANDARRKNDLHIININMEVYYGYAEQYPESLPGCGLPLIYGAKTIIESMPCDPTT